MALKEELERQGVWLFRYRSTLPLGALLAAIIVIIRNEYLGITNVVQNVPAEYYYDLGCLGVGLLGLIIRIYTVGHTPRNTSGRNTREQIADVVNTTGSYSVVRHPLYVGNFFMWLGPALLTANLWFIVAFVLFYWVYYERIMYAEEQFLTRKHGDKYQQWAAGVPAFLPSFKHFKKPVQTFNWRKVVKREKNGLLALFVIFCAFDLLEGFINGSRAFNWFYIYGSLVSAVYYVVVKIIRRYTTWLVVPESTGQLATAE